MFNLFSKQTFKSKYRIFALKLFNIENGNSCFVLCQIRDIKRQSKDQLVEKKTMHLKIMTGVDVTELLKI